MTKHDIPSSQSRQRSERRLRDMPWASEMKWEQRRRNFRNIFIISILLWGIIAFCAYTLLT